MSITDPRWNLRGLVNELLNIRCGQLACQWRFIYSIRPIDKLKEVESSRIVWRKSSGVHRKITHCAVTSSHQVNDFLSASSSFKTVVYRERQKKIISCGILPYLVDIPTTNLNFSKKIYTAILQSCLHKIAKLYYIVTPFD